MPSESRSRGSCLISLRHAINHLEGALADAKEAREPEVAREIEKYRDAISGLFFEVKALDERRHAEAAKRQQGSP